MLTSRDKGAIRPTGKARERRWLGPTTRTAHKHPYALANTEGQPVRSPAASVRVGWRPRVRSEAKPAGKQELAIRRKRSDLLWPSAQLHSPRPRITCEHIRAH